MNAYPLKLLTLQKAFLNYAKTPEIITHQKGNNTIYLLYDISSDEINNVIFKKTIEFMNKFQHITNQDIIVYGIKKNNIGEVIQSLKDFKFSKNDILQKKYYDCENSNIMFEFVLDKIVYDDGNFHNLSFIIDLYL